MVKGFRMKEFATLAEFAVYAEERAALVEEAARMRTSQTFTTEGDWADTYLNPNPNDDECRFCRAMPTCPAWANKVEDTLGMTLEAAADCFDSTEGVPLPATDRLPAAMRAAAGLEDWAKAVRAEVERRLLAGVPVEGYGLELGRQGSRAWTDEEAVETLLRKTFRLNVEQTFELKLKSPTQVEKLAPKRNTKGEIVQSKPGEMSPPLSAKQWDKVQALVTRAPAKPSVKRTSEITTPYVPEAPSADAFDAVPEAEEDLA
jgi:hypothetical protein